MQRKPRFGWPLPFECGFLSPSPCSSLLPHPSLSIRSLFMIAWITGGNKEPAERKVLYKTNEYITGRGGIVSIVGNSLLRPVAAGGSCSFLFVYTPLPTPVLKFVKDH